MQLGHPNYIIVHKLYVCKLTYSKNLHSYYDNDFHDLLELRLDSKLRVITMKRQKIIKTLQTFNLNLEKLHCQTIFFNCIRILLLLMIIFFNNLHEMFFVFGFFNERRGI